RLGQCLLPLGIKAVEPVDKVLRPRPGLGTVRLDSQQASQARLDSLAILLASGRTWSYSRVFIAVATLIRVQVKPFAPFVGIQNPCGDQRADRCGGCCLVGPKQRPVIELEVVTQRDLALSEQFRLAFLLPGREPRAKAVLQVCKVLLL